MNIAEILSVSVNEDNLAWKEGATMPVEYVAALSAASEIGSDLLRVRALDKQAYRRVVLLLANKAEKQGMKKRLFLSPAMAQILAVCAIHEITQPQCLVCRGAKVMVTEKLKVVCHSCGGIGLHRYSDKDRARMCGVSAESWPQWERRYHMVMQILVSNDTAARLSRIKLGKHLYSSVDIG